MRREIQFFLTLLATALAFAPVTHVTTTTTKTTPTCLQMMDSLPHHLASSGILLAETEPWVQPLSLVLDPALNLLSFAMVRTYICCARFFAVLYSTHVTHVVWSKRYILYHDCSHNIVIFTAMSSGTILVSKYEFEQNSLEHCGMAHRTSPPSTSREHPSCVWGGHYAHCVVGRFHLFARNPSGTTRIAHYEDEIWHLTREDPNEREKI
jgi:hypothetical protein